jgi:hypothetical protein
MIQAPAPRHGPRHHAVGGCAAGKAIPRPFLGLGAHLARGPSLGAPPFRRVTAYRFRRYRPPRAGTRGHNTPVPRRISPVPWPTIQPFRSPYPGGSIGAALPSSSRRRSPSPIFAGLGSRTCPATQASLTRRQDSSSYGPVGCSPPKGTLSWRFDGRVSPSAGHQLRGCLAITPTGLSPASRPQLSPGHTEDRLEHDPRRRHHHPIGDTRDAERPQLAWPARLRDVRPPQRPRPVGPGPQPRGELIEELAHPRVHDVADGDPVDARGPAVDTDLAPRPPEHVAAGDLVIDGMKAAILVLLSASRRK